MKLLPRELSKGKTILGEELKAALTLGCPADSMHTSVSKSSSRLLERKHQVSKPDKQSSGPSPGQSKRENLQGEPDGCVALRDGGYLLDSLTCDTSLLLDPVSRTGVSLWQATGQAAEHSRHSCVWLAWDCHGKGKK